jgi:ankyrin repeat protein
MPRTLETTYDRILERVLERGESAAALVERTLHWLFEARPMALSTRQLCEAVSIDIGATSLDSRDLRDIQEILINCSSLVRLSVDGSRLESAHFTVEEYLRSINCVQKPSLSRFLWTATRADTYKSEVCLTALNFDTFDTDLTSDEDLIFAKLRKLPFYIHAVQFCCYKNVDYSSPAFMRLTRRLFCSPRRRNFGNWRQLFVYHWGEDEDHFLGQWCDSISTFTAYGEEKSLGHDADLPIKGLEGGEVREDSDQHKTAWIRARVVSAHTTELHFAAMCHLTPLFKILLDQSCQINYHDSLGTPLHCALASGELLLSVFARRELLMVHFRRLLIEEDLTEFRIALRALISLGADVNIDFCPLGQRRWTTTLIALHAGELNEVIRAGAVLDTDVANLLMRDTKLLQDLTCLELVDISLVSKSDRSAVEQLLEQYKQPKYVDAHNVSQSIAISKDEQEKLFERYEEAIWDACWNDDLHVFQWILEFSDFSVDRPIRGGSFLGFACEAESANIVEYLLAHGAKTDNVEEAAGLAPSGRLFHRAERFNERTLRILQLLLASKVNISIATGSGDSILMRWASVEFENNLDLNPLTNALELLLAHGSDTAHRNRSDECVWHSLARNPKGHHLARLLASRLDADADSISVALELFDSSGQTPLHLAFSLGHPDTARVLLERGSCVSRKTLDGKTVLHLAADSLELSPNAFHLALDFGWSPDDAAFNYPDMFYYCVEKLCENHNIATPGMPVCMRDIMRLFPAWTETITSEFSVKCLNKLARWLKRSVCYLPGDCYEKPGDCTACAARLNCFLALFHELQAHEKQIQSDFAWFKTLCRCTSTKPACLEAIFAVLRSALPVPFLEELVQESYTLNLATFLQDERLFHALLDLQSDVDRRFGQKKDHSFLQRLCRNGAPTSVVEKALIRAKRADVCTPHGDSLLHLCFRSKKTPTIFRKTTVDLLIEKGVNINLRSGYDGMTALMCSAKRSSTTALQSLLLHQADPNLRDHGGYNALSHACESGAHECVRILFNSACPIVFLQKNISPIQPYQSLWCGPLQLAALSGSLQTFEALEELAPFSELSRPDLKSPSVLWVACGTEKTKTALSVVKHLLAQGSDVNYREPSGGTTPLHIASAAGSLECVKLLLEHGSHPAVTDHRGLTAKMYALARGHQEVVRIFASDLGPISSATGIITAPTYRTERLRPHDTLPDLFYGHVAYGDLKALKNLNVDHEGLDLSMSYHSCGCTPMTTALETGQTSVVMYLLNLNVHTRGPDCAVHPASRFPTLGLMAAQPCMLEPLEELLKQCLVVSPALLNYAAHTAAVCGNITALKMLLAAGCPLERPNDTRQLRELGICFLTWTGDWDHIAYIDGSLLLTAVSLQQDRSATVLLDHGFDADALESSGDTVLHTAARMGFVSMLDLLLAKGAHIDVRSADMSTPLITAAAADCSYAVRYFLYRGADMWLTNVHGNSACAASARSGSLDCFMILKSAGSEVRLSDISALYAAGHRTSLMVDDFAQRAVADQDFWTLHSAYLTIPILRMGTLSQRRRNLIVPCTSLRGANHLYVSAAAGHLEKLKLLLGAGATLNLEGGPEGTPLMAACKFGRLDIVRLLVRNGALLGYSKDAKHFSAFAKASSHPKIQRWLLVERFIEQRKITVGVLANVEKAPKVEDNTDTEDIADITLDLVLAEEVEQYLESKNWFLPMRRFIDSGEGAFDKVPILPAEFARYRPKGSHSAP